MSYAQWVGTYMYVFLNIFFRFCTLLYIPVPSLNKDFIIIIIRQFKLNSQRFQTNYDNLFRFYVFLS